MTTKTWTIAGAFTALVITVAGAGVIGQMMAQEATAPADQVTLSEKETTTLELLRAKKRAFEAEYVAQRTQLILEVQEYQTATLAAHPNAPMTFDINTMSWVRKLGTPGATGATGPSGKK